MSVIDHPRLKSKCQIFTPTDIVTKMLDLVGYREQLLGKRVLENCCGDGQFLTQIVERYITSAIREGHLLENVALGLEHDIFAYEIDKDLIAICKNRLDKIALKYNLRTVHWNITCDNFLSANVTGQFNYIIGNPPYIAYQDLPADVRKEIKANFSTCKKGKCDYSYAFIEKSLKMLVHSGKLSYIIPNNIFKNVFAEELRKLIKNDLTTVIDFPQDEVFSNVLVSPAIILVEKGTNTEDLIYTRIIDKISTTNRISKETLIGKWIFNPTGSGGKRTGDYFKVSNSIATLCNRVFVLKNGYFDGNFFCFDNKKIEASILKKAASPKNKRFPKRNSEYIIFPYYYDETNVLRHYNEDEMLEKFPYTMEYLEQHKTELLKRDSDESAKWFEYGRSQALQNMNQRMIIISSVISEDTKAYLLSDNEIPYSGLYIISTGDLVLEDILDKLNSDSFKKYISSVGVSVSGTSKRITTKDIENFMF